MTRYYVLSALSIRFTFLLKGIKGNDLTLLILLIVCSLITFVGNFVSKLITSPLPIIVDFICLVKIFIVFIVYKQVAEYDKKKE